MRSPRRPPLGRQRGISGLSDAIGAISAALIPAQKWDNALLAAAHKGRRRAAYSIVLFSKFHGGTAASQKGDNKSSVLYTTRIAAREAG